MRMIQALLVSTTLACAKPPPPPEAPASHLPPPTTAYQVGDYVIYAYSGSALDAPVEIEEQIVDVAGIELTILVQARRGDETRRWKQRVTDTPQNRNNDVVDELYEIVEGQELHLANPDNIDIYRLYEWIVPPLEGAPTDITQDSRELTIPGRTFEASCTSGAQSMAGTPARFTFCDSEAFLWTSLSGEITAIDGDELLYRMEVQEVGKRERAPEPTTTPDIDGAQARAEAEGWRACETVDDCSIVRCGCSCSGCGGFSADDLVNVAHVDDWYTAAGCNEALICPMVCCPPRELVCHQGQCIAVSADQLSE